MANRFLLPTMLLLAGCAVPPGLKRPPPATRIIVEAQEPWRGIAAAPDAAVLDALPGLWAEALDDARRAGLARRIAMQGSLFDPAAALKRAAPAPGVYLCRLVRIGAAMPGVRPWSESGQGFCFVGVEHDQLSLTIEAGPQRIGGYLWEEKDSARVIFLGATGPHGAPLGGYGDDPARDAVGLFERIGNFRYRLVVPWKGGNRLGVLEMSPAPAQ